MTRVQGKKLRILFVIRAVENYVYAKSIIENLASRGHELEVVFDRRYSSRDLGYLRDLKTSNVKYRWAVTDSSYWRKFFYNCQDILSWRRYFLVRGQSDFYRERWIVYLPLVVKFAIKFPLIRKIIISDFAARLLRLIVNVTPDSSKIVDDLEKFRADVVVATPANMPFSSCDQEYLRAAKVLKIPTVAPVFSWDNLTTKGLLHVVPDLLLVWNKQQIKEAKKHHNINYEGAKIRICGAYFFDHWFNNQRPANRESFCKKYGLDSKKPIFLYLGTSDSLVGDERWLVKKLRENLDKSGSLGKVQIMVRPHPFKNAFKDFSMKNIWVIPKKNTWPNREKSIDLYFNSLYHAFAVVGVNTSGFIDAAILDKPIVAILTEKYNLRQVETEHFKQFVKEKVLDLVDVAGFNGSISRILSGIDKHKKERRKFVGNFIRPLGFKVNAGEAAAIAIEKMVSGKRV